jgi:hypothetical protein
MKERTTKDVVCMKCGHKTRVPASARLRTHDKRAGHVFCMVWDEKSKTYCQGLYRLRK